MSPRASGSSRAPLLAALLLICACGTEGSGPRPEAGTADGDRGVMDAAGRRHAPGTAPSRIVSLVPSATQTLLALGAGDLLVGRTDYDALPSVRELPSVGGGLQPDLEALLVLEPDLVVRFAGPSDPDTPERLDAMGIRHFAVRPDGVDDVRSMVLALATLLGRTGAGAELVDRIDAKLAGVRERVAGRPAVRVAYLLGGSPPWVAGPGTFIDELITVAGGENVFADLDRLYAPVSVEELASRDIDLFLVAPGATLDRRVRERAPAREAPAGLETPGPDLGASAEALARLIHPDAFP